jgi:rhamnose utilization protein RhaD (predicted bifunctional aldolase and dehydrogenase)
MTEDSLISLIQISHAIGEKTAYIQGGGGNTAVKSDDNQMIIKASGSMLKNMNIKNGYCIVDYKAIRNYILYPDKDENVFTQKIQSYVIETNNRPSIETGFHAQLGKYSIHTHSIYANLLTCSKEGKDIVKDLFKEALWVNYFTPGRKLTLAIKDALNSYNKNVKIIFLQNHGIIVVDENAHDTLALHEHINQKIMNYFGIHPVIYLRKTYDMDYVKRNVIFPDQVVYTLAGEKILNTSAARETLWAHDYILQTMKRLNLTPNYLPQNETKILLDMENEKFRQKVLTK